MFWQNTFKKKFKSKQMLRLRQSENEEKKN